MAQHTHHDDDEPCLRQPDKPMKWADLMGFAPEIVGGRTIEQYLKDARGED